MRSREPDGATLTFDDYLQRGQLCVDHPVYTEPGAPQRVIVDEVLQYDRLNDDLARTFRKLGIPFQPPLAAAAKAEVRTDRRPYHRVYTERQRDRIAHAFAHELDLFGYHFDSPGAADPTSAATAVQPSVDGPH